MTQQQPEEAPAARPPDDASEGDARLSYEDARDELVAVVQRLENGGVSLQESVALWERGERLADVCQRWLDGARARLDAAMKDAE